MNKIATIILGIVLVALLGGGIYYFINKTNNTSTNKNLDSTTAQTQLEFNAYKSGNQNDGSQDKTKPAVGDKPMNDKKAPNGNVPPTGQLNTK
ncbi:MAG TPA: hypothetical protein PLZ62_02330 [bacterium]|nr:hypothetical protein [bacterium]